MEPNFAILFISLTYSIVQNFDVDWFRSFGSGEGQNAPFSIGTITDP